MYPNICNLDMQLFPGCCVRLKHLPAGEHPPDKPYHTVALVFRSGGVIITGAKTLEDAKADFSHFINTILSKCWDDCASAERSSANYRQMIEKINKEKEAIMVISGASALVNGQMDKKMWELMMDAEDITKSNCLLGY
jgi:TATA-box binding protein (TBP) (component of TFIID and TFIIIB)